MAQRRFSPVVLIVIAVLLLPPRAARAQFQSPATSAAVGGACSGSNFILPDANGHILQCVSSVWTAVSDAVWSVSGSNVYYNGGNVGIGTASPASNLHIWDNTHSNGQNAQLLTLDTGENLSSGAPGNGAVTIAFRSSGGVVNDGAIGGYMAGVSNTGLALWGGTNYSTTPTMYINSSGNVGIGVTNPGNLLVVSSSSATANAVTIQKTSSTTFTNATDPILTLVSNGAANDAVNMEFLSTGVLNTWGIKKGTNTQALTVNITGTPVEALDITNTGNVGIGVTSPDHVLNPMISNNTVGNYYPISVRLDRSSTSSSNRGVGVSFSESNNGTGQDTMAAVTGIRENSNSTWYGDLAFEVNETNGSNGSTGESALTEAMRITGSNGNVGIGTTGPDSNLEVSSSGATNVSINGASANATLKFENSGTMEWQMYNDTANSNSIKITNGTTGVKLNQGDSLWSSVSDARLKTDVQPLSVLDRLGNFRAVTFHWKGTKMPAATQLGVIAQEVYPLFPEVVTKGSDNPDEAVTPLSHGAWTVKYELLGPLALEGVKELKAAFDGDHEDIAKLKAANDNLAAEHTADAKAIDELRREVAELRREVRAQ